MFAPLCFPLVTHARRGGWRQNLGQAGAQAPRAPSRQALGLLKEWGDGFLSARQVCWHSWLAVQDGEVTHPMLHRLASLYDPTNPHKGVSNRLLSLLEGAALDSCIVPTGGTIVSHMVSPFRLVETLHAQWPGRFSALLGIDEAAILRFWTDMRTSAPDEFAEIRGRPGMRDLQPNQLGKVVPLTLHEDAGPFIKRSSVNIISFNGLFSRAGEKVSQFPVATFIKQGMLSSEQEQSLWNPILAEFTRLAQEGVGGWRFVLLFAKGDMENRSVTWGLKSYNAAGEMCSECLANRSDRPFTDLRADAAWRLTRLTTPQYCERSRIPLHPLLACGFMWRYFTPLDCMHVCDSNGVMSIVAGSVLRHVISDPALGPNQDSRLGILNSRLRSFYDSRPGVSKMPDIRVKNLTDERGWHVLHGPLVKAANTRNLSGFLVTLTDEFYSDSVDEHVQLMCRVCRAMHRFYQIIYSAGVVLGPGEQAELRRVLFRFGATFQRLRALAAERDVMAWQITPKVHAMQHFGDFGRVLNPRWVQNYTEESHVGTVTAIWKRSAHGHYRANVQRLALLKRLVSLYIRLEGV